MQAHQPQGGDAKASTLEAGNHPDDVQAIYALFIKYVGFAHVDEQMLIELRDRTYALGRARGRMEGTRDTQRLYFMLSEFRKVVVEVLPGNRKEVYVESGFMGDERGPSVMAKSDIGSDELLEMKRRAIDLAMAQEADRA